MKIEDVFSPRSKCTERIIQFGEGNFLRAFFDWIVMALNASTDFDSSVVVVQPIEVGLINELNAQDGLYTLFLSGDIDDDIVREHLVCDSISRGIDPYSDFNSFLALAHDENFRLIVSNTTEAGITFNQSDTKDAAPPASFPAKLTRLLYERYLTFGNDAKKGFIILPCELIDKNGALLREAVIRYAALWELGSDFIAWIDIANIFCNTLVDRIVPGYPSSTEKEKLNLLGYEDKLMIEAERYYVWVIETKSDIVKKALPTGEAKLNVIFTQDLTPYRIRKVRILNGVHTAVVPMCYLSGFETQAEVLHDKCLSCLYKKVIWEEILPTLDENCEELQKYADNVMRRFQNPNFDHQLIRICLNSVSKYKVRVLPTLLEYVKRKGSLPKVITLGMSALIAFYRGKRGNENIVLSESQNVLEMFSELWSGFDYGRYTVSDIVKVTLGNKSLWDMDLNIIPGLTSKVSEYLECIVSRGMRSVLEEVLNG